MTAILLAGGCARRRHDLYRDRAPPEPGVAQDARGDWLSRRVGDGRHTAGGLCQGACIMSGAFATLVFARDVAAPPLCCGRPGRRLPRARSGPHPRPRSRSNSSRPRHVRAVAKSRSATSRTARHPMRGGLAGASGRAAQRELRGDLGRVADTVLGAGDGRGVGAGRGQPHELTVQLSARDPGMEAAIAKASAPGWTISPGSRPGPCSATPHPTRARARSGPTGPIRRRCRNGGAPRVFLPNKRIDLRAGGEWVFDMIAPDGTVFPNHHRYVEVREAERLAYTLLWGENGPKHADAWVSFDDEGGSTLVTLAMAFSSEAEVPRGTGLRRGSPGTSRPWANSRRSSARRPKPSGCKGPGPPPFSGRPAAAAAAQRPGCGQRRSRHGFNRQAPFAASAA